MWWKVLVPVLVLCGWLAYVNLNREPTLPEGRYELSPRGYVEWHDDGSFVFSSGGPRTVQGRGLSALNDQLKRDHFQLAEPEIQTTFETALTYRQVVDLPDGPAGVEKLAALGHIRPAKNSELDLWLTKAEAVAAQTGETPVLKLVRHWGMKVWTITQQTRLPKQLGGADLTVFHLPEGVPRPWGHFRDSILLLPDGTHEGPKFEAITLSGR